jgi:hypothetical protein
MLRTHAFHGETDTADVGHVVIRLERVDLRELSWGNAFSAEAIISPRMRGSIPLSSIQSIRPSLWAGWLNLQGKLTTPIVAKALRMVEVGPRFVAISLE